ncbi:MAG: hypothetical protein CSB33_02805 [Desulfobacterales bacterium]|nr:MAG: hypothetical protein CSB33_02805 [Desulfobacterales bacterium]
MTIFFAKPLRILPPLLLLAAACLAPALSRAENAAPSAGKMYMNALAAWHRGEYKAAALSFQTVAENGVVNGDLYYNIGNAWLRAGETGRAIYWYERAKLLIGNDPDLNFNLAHAQGLRKDAPAPGPSALIRVLLFWKTCLSPPVLRALTLFASFLCAVLLTLAILKNRSRRSAGIIASGLAALLLMLTVMMQYREQTAGLQGIVLPSEISVRSGFGSASTELFRLHAGTRVAVLETREGHVKIRYSEDKIGWIPGHDIGRIRR